MEKFNTDNQTVQFISDKEKGLLPEPCHHGVSHDPSNDVWIGLRGFKNRTMVIDRIFQVVPTNGEISPCLDQPILSHFTDPPASYG